MFVGEFISVFIYQTIYFLLCVQSLCALLLFDKYHAKWRDICIYFPLLFMQFILVGASESSANSQNLTNIDYACFVVSILGFGYLMRLLYLIAKAKNKADKKSKKDFIYVVIIIILSFMLLVAKMLYDFL